MEYIYLDNNSTTLIDNSVAIAMSDCRSKKFVNPSSQHQAGQRARRHLEKIRDEILLVLGAENRGISSDQLIFTSGGTESNNLALIGLSFEPDGSLPDRKRVLISSIEHPSLIGASEFLRRQGFIIDTIPVTKNGVVDLERFGEMVDESVRVVSVMLVNNETGVIQPVREICKICHQFGVICHTDAVQGVGKLSVEFKALAVDALSFTAHKLHGPRGIGGLILKNHLRPFPLFYGGFQQQGFRPGTEDVCLAVGMQTAIKKFATKDESQIRRAVGVLRNRLQQRIVDGCSHAEVIGIRAERVAHTLNVAFRGVNRQELLLAADMNGLAISTGSACASGSSEPSPVLLAMGVDKDLVQGSIRISLSVMTTEQEIDQSSERIIKIANDLRR